MNTIESMRKRGLNVPFTRIRRITGYLVGGLERFNTGKLNEVNERVKHSTVLQSGTDTKM